MHKKRDHMSLNKPTAQTAGADSYQRNSTNRQIPPPPSSKVAINFEPVCDAILLSFRILRGQYHLDIPFGLGGAIKLWEENDKLLNQCIS